MNDKIQDISRNSGFIDTRSDIAGFPRIAADSTGRQMISKDRLNRVALRGGPR